MARLRLSPLLGLDFADRSGSPRRLAFAEPVDVLVALAQDEVIPVLRAVQEAANSGLYAAGYVAYEAAPAFDPAFGVRPDVALPLAWFGLFSQPLERSYDDVPGPPPIGTGAGIR